MILNAQTDGVVSTDPQQIAQLTAQGYIKCETMKKPGGGTPAPCPFYISPVAQNNVAESADGYYTCPVCHMSYQLVHKDTQLATNEEQANYNYQRSQEPGGFVAGGVTHAGIRMDQQAQIGEQLVEQLGEIPGYGKITWWHQGGAAVNSPLDGATDQWGIEVKTLGYDAKNHRFIPGRPEEKQAKVVHAKEMGLQGVLGVLVLLNYRSSKADIFVRAYPGDSIGAFYSTGGMHLLKEVPFTNPYLDPSDPTPVTPSEALPATAPQSSSYFDTSGQPMAV